MRRPWPAQPNAVRRLCANAAAPRHLANPDARASVTPEFVARPAGPRPAGINPDIGRSHPPATVHRTPVPAQVMHSRTLRRFSPLTFGSDGPRGAYSAPGRQTVWLIRSATDGHALARPWMTQCMVRRWRSRRLLQGGASRLSRACPRSRLPPPGKSSKGGNRRLGICEFGKFLCL